MDVLNGEKLFVKYCYKRSQLFLYNLSLNSLIIFIFGFWLSSQSNRFPTDVLSSIIKMVVTPPPIFSPRCLFVVVNVIVLYIVGEQKLVGGAKLSLVNWMYDKYYVKRMEEMANMSRGDNVSSQLVEKLVVEEKEEEVIRTIVALDGADGNGKKKKRKDEVKDDYDYDYDHNHDYDYDYVLANKEFIRRAEAFIARVNKQRKLDEAVDCCQ